MHYAVITDKQQPCIVSIRLKIILENCVNHCINGSENN